MRSDLPAPLPAPRASRVAGRVACERQRAGVSRPRAAPVQDEGLDTRIRCAHALLDHRWGVSIRVFATLMRYSTTGTGTLAGRVACERQRAGVSRPRAAPVQDGGLDTRVRCAHALLDHQGGVSIRVFAALMRYSTTGAGTPAGRVACERSEPAYRDQGRSLMRYSTTVTGGVSVINVASGRHAKRTGA